MQRGEIPAALLSDVKGYLQITWTDQATDDRIRGLIASGTVYLDGIGGEPLDYLRDGEPRTLLFEYVRYARDAALDVFENNYRHLILALGDQMRSLAYVEKTLSAGSCGQPDL